jgi:hypothetical protein
MTKFTVDEETPPLTQADPAAGSSLIPMLISGLVLIVIGMIGVMVFG